MDAVDMKNGGIYKDYEDWYDNGPGSEKFKQGCRNTKLSKFPDLTPEPKDNRIFVEQLNDWDKTITLTIRLPQEQWLKHKHMFMELLHRIRRS
jgi:hypothetical protein